MHLACGDIWAGEPFIDGSGLESPSLMALGWRAPISLPLQHWAGEPLSSLGWTALDVDKMEWKLCTAVWAQKVLG